MKRMLIFLILMLIPFSVYASKKEVKFNKCVDGDTATVILNTKSIKLRFLAIDTPESVHPTKGVEPYGKEASEYTCNMLKNAKKIEIEYDPNSEKTDKYDRHLVWIYVDDLLLQKDLVSKGYAKIAYLYGDYLYTHELEKVELNARDKKLRIWSDYIENSEEKDGEESIIEYIINIIYEIFEKILDFLIKIIADML